MLEITRGEFAYDMLKQAGKQFGLFPESEFICLNLFLSFGNISNIKSVNTRNVFGETIDIKSQIEKLLNTAKRHNKARIWTSTITTEDYLTMMFVVDLLKSENIDIEINIIDSVNVPISNKYPYTPAWELACLEVDSIKKLLAYEETITYKNTSLIVQKWNDTVKINSPLRICSNSIIKSVNGDNFDQIILDVIKKLGKAGMSEVIGTTMARCNHSDGNLCDWFFADRLEKLIKIGKIKIEKHDEIKHTSIITLT